MKDRTNFFTSVRKTLFNGRFSQSQVDGMNILIDAAEDLPVSWVAYLLATAYHECAKTMQPIAEYGRGKGRKYGSPGRNNCQVPYGRGFVQLTWDENYEKADKELGLGGKLISDYDLALNPTIAAMIAVRGMQEGWFTGKAFKDYLPGDYHRARKIINGLDKANAIAQYAKAFEAALALQSTQPRKD